MQHKITLIMTTAEKSGKSVEGVIIANPIYDTVFKHLMENRRIARFFVETLIGEKVKDIAMVPQEYTYRKIIRTKKRKESQDDDTKEEFFSIIRFDFVATIHTAQGKHKKVLIEIQKSRKPTDLIRFRTYLGEQYKRLDMVNTNTGQIEKALPIICIYLLGFTIPKHNTQATKVDRIYWDMIHQKEIKQKCELIESLTHDGYFVQIPRIKGKPRTLLEEMLSVFKQEYFIDEKNIIKKYEHPIDNEFIREMVDILRHTAADPEKRREIEEEWFAVQDEEEYEKALKALEEKDKAIEEKDKALEEKDKAIEEKDKALEEKDKALELEKKALAAAKVKIQKLEQRIRNQQAQ